MLEVAFYHYLNSVSDTSFASHLFKWDDYLNALGKNFFNDFEILKYSICQKSFERLCWIRNIDSDVVIKMNKFWESFIEVSFYISPHWEVGMWWENRDITWYIA